MEKHKGQLSDYRSYDLMEEKMREEEARLENLMFVTRMGIRLVQEQLPAFKDYLDDLGQMIDRSHPDFVETEQIRVLEQYEEYLSLIRRLEAARAQGTMSNESLKDPDGLVFKYMQDEMGEFGNLWQVAQSCLELAKPELDNSHGIIADLRQIRARNKPGFLQKEFLSALDWSESLQVLIEKLQEIQKRGYL